MSCALVLSFAALVAGIIDITPADGLGEARRRAAAAPKPVTVRLSPGTYRLERPFALGPSDSGVTFAAAGDAVITGAREVKGWRVEPDGTWSAAVDWVTPSRETSFRILSVGGVRRPRARLPKQGFYTVVNDDLPEGTAYNVRRPSFFYDPAEFKSGWSNLDSAEITVFSFWCDNHLRIAAVDPATNKVTFVTPSGKAFDTGWKNNKTGGRRGRYFVENIPAAMTEPGEWWCDFSARRVHYRPLPDERIDGFVAEVPFVRELVVIRGTPLKDARFAEDIVFRGVRFEMSQFEHGPKDTNDAQASASVAAAVTLAGARRCRFEGCSFDRLSGYAVGMGRGAFDNVFSRCTLTGLGGGGFIIDGGAFGCHRFEEASGNVIADCEIGPYGRGFHSSVGVLMKNCEKCRVEHCHVFDGYYTGISLGWTWGYYDTDCRLNVISKNHIHDIGQEWLSDMGAIYMLGPSYGTVVSGNLIHGVRSDAYGGWGIYNDEGSTGILIEDNIVYDTRFAAYDIHFAKDITVRNNVFALGEIDQLNRSRAERHLSCDFRNNIVYWRQGTLQAGDWSDAKEPYTRYYRPIGRPGGDRGEVTATFAADYNLYFNPDAKPDDRLFFGDRSFDEWRRTGKDVHSLWADPLFVDPDARDFRLRPDSPAIALGFRPIDPSDVGPRKE